MYTRNKPHACPYAECQETFSRNVGLQAHMRQHANSTAGASDSEEEHSDSGEDWRLSARMDSPHSPHSSDSSGQPGVVAETAYVSVIAWAPRPSASQTATTGQEREH